MSQSVFYHFFRHSLFLLFLIVLCPPAAIIYVVHQRSVRWLSKSFTSPLYSRRIFYRAVPYLETCFLWNLERVAIIRIFIVVQLLLIRVMLVKQFKGSLTLKKNIPVYKAKGVTCFFLALLLFYLSAYQWHWLSDTIVYDNFIRILGALNIFSLFFLVSLFQRP